MGELGDPVKAPAHYAGDGVITCKDALKSMLTNSKLSPIQGYWIGCLFKYVWRFEHKNGIQDLEKAIYYLKNEIYLMKNDSNNKDNK